MNKRMLPGFLRAISFAGLVAAAAGIWLRVLGNMGPICLVLAVAGIFITASALLLLALRRRFFGVN